MEFEEKQEVSVEVASMILRAFQSRREFELGNNDILVRAIDVALECMRVCTIEEYKQKGYDKYIDLDKLLD